MHLNDSLGREARIRYICNHHEQACAMAAEAYARVTGKVGVINVTSGPGGINSLSGVFGAWTDSIPMLVISGQVKRETCMATSGRRDLRQLGDQEVDIVRMVQGITKYAVLIEDPLTIRYHLERAYYLARSGRPGPCWLDIPVDVQSAMLDEASLDGYNPEEDQPKWNLEKVREQCREILQRSQSSPRPVIMAGSGVRLANAVELFQTVVRKLRVPVTTAWTGHDLFPSDDPLYCGRPGTVGDRPGNFTVQNADLLLVIGCRLHIRQISYNWKSFARAAYKIQVDVDAAEFNKPTVRPDMAVHCDAKLFLEELNRQLDDSRYDPTCHAQWLAWCRERVRRYPVLQPKHCVKGAILDPYYFVHALFQCIAADDVVVCGDGAACVIPFQVGQIRNGQRMFANAGCAAMGYDLPAAIGAAIARDGKRVICLAGDGSIQLNIQELQTVAHQALPIKIFVLNNGGYLSIRSTQQSFFGRLVGESPASGLSFPDMVQVGKAYGLPAVRLASLDFETTLDNVLRAPGPVLCEVLLDPARPFEPRVSSRVLPDGRIVSSPLEDLYPFLESEELLSNLLIPRYES